MYRLTPTQLVVISLLNLLPRASYHVYLDNLFSSPDLFKQLYDIGIGASGTARVNSGINTEIAAVKTSKKRRRSGGGQCKPVRRLTRLPGEIMKSSFFSYRFTLPTRLLPLYDDARGTLIAYTNESPELSLVMRVKRSCLCPSLSTTITTLWGQLTSKTSTAPPTIGSIGGVIGRGSH